MRNYLVFVLLVGLFTTISCNKDKDDDGCPLAPPSWIQGTWEGVEIYFGYEYEYTWIFEPNNALHTYEGDGSTLNYCIEANDPTIFITELEKTDSRYQVNLTSTVEGVLNSFSFVKIDENTICFTSGEAEDCADPSDYNAGTYYRQ